MGSDILGVSITGLKVSQAALRTTGHNIANANTEGFSRQQTEINTVNPSFTGSGYVGNGAYTASIERIVNGFVDTRVVQDTSFYNQLNAFNEKALELNGVLANENTSLTRGLNSFFAAMQNATDDPTSLPARQLVLSETDGLVSQFNILQTRINEIEAGVEADLNVAVSKINKLGENIALMNKRIAESYSADGNSAPNDLLDQRQKAINELSELVDIKLFEQGDSQVNVIIGGSQTLVTGSQARSIVVGQNSFEPAKSEIYFVNNGVQSTTPISDSIEGGTVKGLLDFRDTMLPSAYNELGRVAIVLSDQFNELQAAGITLDNEFGKPLFGDINSDLNAQARVFANVNNADNDNQVALVTIDDTQQLTTSDYLFEVDASRNLYTVTRVDDNKELTKNIMPASLPASISFDGLTLTIESGQFSSGDKLLIKPTSLGAQSIEKIIQAPEDLALGIPVLTSTNTSNTGTGSVSSGEILGLVDSNGDTLPLLANPGELAPPVIIRFTSETTYDILDNSDPGNPVSLNPPLNNLSYVPGAQNQLFPGNINETTVVSRGASIGLPLGRQAITQASLQPATGTPAFGVTDFSTAANQFSFDIVVSNTSVGANDGTFTVTIDNPAITDSNSLAAAINQDLAGTDVNAYIDDTGELAFRLASGGFGDITVQNYDGDPDGTTTAAAGQANTLLGFDVEGSTFTTVAGANGSSGDGTSGNGYPAEAISIVTTDPVTGSTTSQNIFTRANASANETAGLLDNIQGVSASAYTQVELTDANVTLSPPLQLSINGEPLIAYSVDPVTGDSIISPTVPDPSLNGGSDFNDYLAEQINANPALSALEINAVSVFNPITNDYTVNIMAHQGHDIDVDFTAVAGENIAIGDSENPSIVLAANGANVESTISIGGTLQVNLSDNISFTTLPPDSLLFGNSLASDFSQSSYLGLQVSMTGSPESGDTFTVDFNSDAVLDNRNGLKMSNLQTNGIIGSDNANFNTAYNRLIEEVAIDTSASQINAEAAEKVLQQTTDLRNSISGVNLDEEAANLIRFEQLYSANARVITVARELFDQLLNSV